MHDKLNNVSAAAVKKATGEDWDSWIEKIDKFGGEKLSHKEIARRLESGGLDGWWAQMVTVGYEYAKGRRVVGETEETGFQIGVQRTFDLDIATLWQLVVHGPGRAVWLGRTKEPLMLEKGARYQTTDGTSGEIRTLATQKRLRLTWQPADWDKSSTLQLNFIAKGEKSVLGFHQEKLPNAKARARMKAHWQTVLEKLQEL